MSGGQVKNSVQVYIKIYYSDKLFGNRTSKVKIWLYLPEEQVKILRFFTPDMSVCQ